MVKGTGPVYAVMVIFALLVLAGFYLIFEKITTTNITLSNLELQLQTLKDQTKGQVRNIEILPESRLETSPKPEEPKEETLPSTNIPTAIILEASSSMLLQPQVKLTITVDNITKDSQGTVVMNFKVFTSEATAFSAIEPRDLFQLVALEGDNQRSIDVKGQFNSMPPKSAITGSLIFKIDPSKNTIILQAGSGDMLKFYEFNFIKKTYKETVIG
ncbi:hypothetical protein HY967_03355 [Candidatus Jorgensenbacteria bacterium]|nr:hypothetical protein [Candidatus Jorgensenbacteria bacterium]